MKNKLGLVISFFMFGPFLIYASDDASLEALVKDSMYIFKQTQKQESKHDDCLLDNYHLLAKNIQHTGRTISINSKNSFMLVPVIVGQEEILEFDLKEQDEPCSPVTITCVSPVPPVHPVQSNSMAAFLKNHKMPDMQYVNSSSMAKPKSVPKFVKSLGLEKKYRREIGLRLPCVSEESFLTCAIYDTRFQDADNEIRTLAKEGKFSTVIKDTVKNLLLDLYSKEKNETPEFLSMANTYILARDILQRREALKRSDISDRRRLEYQNEINQLLQKL